MALFTGDWAPGNLDIEIEHSLDFVFSNLEGPFAVQLLLEDWNYPKVGPKLQSKKLPLEVIGLANLANNHIMDFGKSGLEQTIDLLDKNGILHVGTGLTVEDSRKPIQFFLENHSIIVISCAERQFGESRHGHAGFAAFGPWVYSAIQRLSKNGTFVVVSYHGGIENSSVPSPELQETFRTFIELGASLVWGHHAHVPQGWEYYEQGLILYGLGNFATDPLLISHEGMGKYSLAVEVDFENIQHSNFYVTKQEVIGGDICVSFADYKNSEILSHIEQSNHTISDPVRLAERWGEISKSNYENFYGDILNIDQKIVATTRDLWRLLISRVKHRNFRNSPFSLSQKQLALHLLSTDAHRISIVDHLTKLTSSIKVK